MKPKVIVWDWDNTLVDSRQAVRESLNELMTEYHLPLPTEQDITNVMGTHMGCFWYDNFGDNRIQVIDYYLSLYRKYRTDLKLFPIVPEVLSWVREQGILQYVVSNKHQEFVDEECDTFGIRHFFQKVIGSDNRNLAKPNKALADEIFGKVYPSPMLMIGDGESDMQFAETLGAFGLFIRPGNETLPYKYDMRVPDLPSVLSFLKEYIRNQH